MWEASRWNDRYQMHGHPFAMSPHDYMFRQRDEVYRRLMPRGGNRRILEVGAAPGDWLVYFYWELGLVPTGIDFAVDGVKKARQKMQHFGVPGEVICADFLKHDFGRARYEIVFFQGSLEHFPDPLIPLRRAIDLCAPGGMIFAQIPCFARDSVNYQLSNWLGRKALAEHYLRDQADLERAFSSAGLPDVKVEALGTFQLMIEADPDLGALRRASLRAVEATSRLATPLLGRLDLRRQTRSFSPHLLAYAPCP